MEIVRLSEREAAGWVEVTGLTLKLWGEFFWAVLGKSLGSMTALSAADVHAHLCLARG